MGINHWPEAERPREKLISRGPASLSDAELLAIFLRTGRHGRSAVDMARELIQHFGGLRGLLGAEAATLCALPGLGPAKVAQIQAALEMARRHLGEALSRGPALSSSRDTRDYLIARLRDRPHEVFCCLYLDNRHRVLGFEELFAGTLNGTAVYPREVVKRALAHNAAAVIVGHNHPSGVSEPSEADRSITLKLAKALALVEIRLLDHVVVSRGGHVSLAERGLV